MSFDKIKAMRSAERFLTQGKIRSAIDEYKKIVEDNPKDFSTLNILGDLYIKDSVEAEAIKCYMQVAEYYNGQGFANKAIAVYSKISKIVPDSVEISGKLAHLYQTRGSNAEARFHYQVLADNYESTGRKPEAIAIWNKIAELDPKNTEVYLKIAETSRNDRQIENAAAAYTKAGLRFCEQKQYELAIEAFKNTLDIKEFDLDALKGFVEAKIGLESADEAINILKDAIEKEPYNKDLRYLLVDCYLNLDETVEAEKLTIQLVEQEPANYHKLVELVEIYSKKNDLESAIRVLSIASEYLLTGGQAVDFLKWTNEILARNPENIDALRMLVRYHTWQRDETEVKNSLERLVETAQETDNFEEERDALARLTMMYPRDSKYAERMHELKVKHNLGDSITQIEKIPFDTPAFENFNESDGSGGSNGNKSEIAGQYERFDGDVNVETDIGFQTFRDLKPEDLLSANDEFDKSSNGQVVEMQAMTENGFQITDASGFQSFGNDSKNESSETYTSENSLEETNSKLNLVDTLRLNKEIESIEFYINQGYIDIAVKSFISLKDEFGVREEFAHLGRCLADKMPEPNEMSGSEETTENLSEVETDSFETEDFESFGDEEMSIPSTEDNFSTESFFDVSSETNEDELIREMPPIELEVEENSTPHSQNLFEDLRSDLGLEETEETVNENDYDTHYQTAIVYQEMGLMEDAIKEFQNAINLVEINDGTRKFFQCANLLGHCFMVKEMPTLAITWFNRAFETDNLNDNEVLALNYEIAHAYESAKDFDKAIEFFETIYAEDVEYRDVSDRLENLKESMVSA